MNKNLKIAGIVLLSLAGLVLLVFVIILIYRAVQSSYCNGSLDCFGWSAAECKNNRCKLCTPLGSPCKKFGQCCDDDEFSCNSCGICDFKMNTGTCTK